MCIELVFLWLLLDWGPNLLVRALAITSYTPTSWTCWASVPKAPGVCVVSKIWTLTCFMLCIWHVSRNTGTQIVVLRLSEDRCLRNFQRYSQANIKSSSMRWWCRLGFLVFETFRFSKTPLPTSSTMVLLEAPLVKKRFRNPITSLLIQDLPSYPVEECAWRTSVCFSKMVSKRHFKSP